MFKLTHILLTTLTSIEHKLYITKTRYKALILKDK